MTKQPETTDINYLINSQKYKTNNDISDNESIDGFTNEFIDKTNNIINTDNDNDNENVDDNRFNNLSENNNIKDYKKDSLYLKDNNNFLDEFSNHLDENFKNDDIDSDKKIKIEIETEQDESENLIKNIKKKINISDFKEILADGGYEKLTDPQKKLAKFHLLMELAELIKSSGIMVTTEYNLDSDYEAIKLEYDYHIGARAKKKTINMFYTGIIGLSKTLETINDWFNPFGLDLTGWSLNLESSREELLETLTELYNKYYKSGQPITPEIRLLFIIVQSAIITVMSNAGSSFISSMFSKNEILNNKDIENIKKSLNNEEKQNQNQNQKQNQNQEQDQDDNSSLNKKDIIQKYNEEKQEREIKLIPPILPNLLINNNN